MGGGGNFRFPKAFLLTPPTDRPADLSYPIPACETRRLSVVLGVLNFTGWPGRRFSKQREARNSPGAPRAANIPPPRPITRRRL